MRVLSKIVKAGMRGCCGKGETPGGFTLIELIVTVAILSFGIVAIYETFFISIDTYGFYRRYLSTQDWIHEKIVAAEDGLTRSGMLDVGRTSGQIVRGQKAFVWTMDVYPLDEEQGLYQVEVSLSWQEGGKRAGVSRAAYILPPQLRAYHEEGIV